MALLLIVFFFVCVCDEFLSMFRWRRPQTRPGRGGADAAAAGTVQSGSSVQLEQGAAGARAGRSVQRRQRDRSRQQLTQLNDANKLVWRRKTQTK